MIALIEDNEDDAFFIKRALHDLGFREKLLHFTETEEAMSYFGGEGEFSDRTEFPLPSIIMADSAVSARESGIEFLEWVRGRKEHAALPFVILSGGVSESTRLRAERAGVRNILVKGSTRDELRDQIRLVIREFPPECRKWLAEV